MFYHFCQDKNDVTIANKLSSNKLSEKITYKEWKINNLLNLETLSTNYSAFNEEIDKIHICQVIHQS